MMSEVEDRASFVARLLPVVPPGQMIDIEWAYMFSKYAHRAQKRMEIDGTGAAVRYFEHPRRVALILIDTVGVIDSDMICAALLHDVVEDSVELSPAGLERHFGVEVARIVQVLSKTPKEGYVERLRRYADWKALTIKMADRLDNLRSLHVEGVPPEFISRQIAETRDKYMGIFERALDIAPEYALPGLNAVMAEIEGIVGV